VRLRGALIAIMSACPIDPARASDRGASIMRTASADTITDIALSEIFLCTGWRVHLLDMTDCCFTVNVQRGLFVRLGCMAVVDKTKKLSEDREP
jgi:hypothetical protein